MPQKMTDSCKLSLKGTKSRIPSTIEYVVTGNIYDLAITQQLYFSIRISSPLNSSVFSVATWILIYADSFVTVPLKKCWDFNLGSEPKLLQRSLCHRQSVLS